MHEGLARMHMAQEVDRIGVKVCMCFPEMPSTNLRCGIHEKGFAPVLILKLWNSHCFVVI